MWNYIINIEINMKILVIIIPLIQLYFYYVQRINKIRKFNLKRIHM